MSRADPLAVATGATTTSNADDLGAACDLANSQLMSIAQEFDFLLALSPTNTNEAMHRWFADGCSGDPDFRYRDLDCDPAALRKRLHQIELTHLSEPLVEGLLIEKRHEIDHQLACLETRFTPEFKQHSEELYGAVSDALHEAATQVLERTERQPACGTACGAEEIADRARDLIALYQARDPDFDPQIEIRDDVTGLLVSYPKLMISRSARVSERRVEPLLHHELSIHMVTGFNGDQQPLPIFMTGLAGYEEIQEGLGVFAEWAVGGLYSARLRLIAGRVIAVRAMLEGATFADCFHMLRRDCRFTRSRAFKLAARVYRSGGLAKDAIYLRGFFRVMELIAKEGDLSPYWIGKIAPVHVPVVKEMADMGLVKPARLTPSFLERDDVQQRLTAYRADPRPERWLSTIESSRP